MGRRAKQLATTPCLVSVSSPGERIGTLAWNGYRHMGLYFCGIRHGRRAAHHHRSSLLHSLVLCTSDGFGLSSADSALLVVPMFHVNAGGMTEMSPLGTVCNPLPWHAGTDFDASLDGWTKIKNIKIVTSIKLLILNR